MFLQHSETIFLWPERVPNTSATSEKKVQSIENTGVTTKIIEVKFPSLTVFKPKENSNGKAIIVCPGGGYTILAIDLEGFEIAEWLTNLGYTVFVLKYSIPDMKMEALNDLKRAIKIVRGNANKYQINLQKIGVLGFSAGANLCAKVSAVLNKETYTEIDEMDTISCRPDFTILIYPAYLDTGTNGTLSPELKISNNTPPMFIFGTEDDSYANSALVMANSLKEKNVSFEFHFSPKGGHGYGLRKGNIAAETWPKLAEIWLNKF
ncbi:MAG: alpha/beta hydrolase [Lutibacter sp.]|nr:alpha/beta hydrolase [Lutibacter sp.]